MYEIYISDLPLECIQDCSAPGPADELVKFWRNALDFMVPINEARKCLAGYGAWTPEELAAKNEIEIAEIILWLACGDFSEWDGTDESPCGSDIFCLE